MLNIYSGEQLWSGHFPPATPHEDFIYFRKRFVVVRGKQH